MFLFSEIASFMIFGIPVVIYLGIITLALLLFTATISTLNKRKIRIIHMKWHHRMAYVTIVFALCHALLIFLSTI
jgi:dolichyl-phosphate-mannose--protein O-mannosyl transferase